MFDNDDRPHTRLYKKTQKYISAKFKVENELLPKKGHMAFFHHRQLLSEIYQIYLLVKFVTNCFRAIDPPKGGTIRKFQTAITPDRK